MQKGAHQYYTLRLAPERLTRNTKFFKACAKPGDGSYLGPALRTIEIAEVGDWPSSWAAVLKGPAWLTVKSKAELAGVARQRLAPAVLLLLAADLSDRLAVALSMAMVVVHLG